MLWQAVKMFWPLLLFQGVPWAIRTFNGWRAARNAPRPAAEPRTAAARWMDRIVLVTVTVYVVSLLLLSLREPPSVYQVLGTHPRATNYELKRRLGDALGRAGYATAPADLSDLPAPLRGLAETVGKIVESPNARIAYDQYGAETGMCSYCHELEDYSRIAAVDTALTLVVFVIVSGLSTSLVGTHTLRSYPIVMALLWTLVQAFELVDRPLAFLTSWTPYEQGLHFRRLVLALLAVGPFLFRDDTQLSTKDRLLTMVVGTASTIERNKTLLAARRQATAGGPPR